MKKPLEPSTLLEVSKRSEWRAWLRRNHKTAKVVWLVFYKKHTGRPRIAYNDAVEEALAFGWIDSTAKKVDEDRYAQRFTPRNPKSPYSEANVARLRAMAAKGKIIPEVLAKVEPLLAEKPVRHPARHTRRAQSRPGDLEELPGFFRFL